MATELFCPMCGCHFGHDVTDVGNYIEQLHTDLCVEDRARMIAMCEVVLGKLRELNGTDSKEE